MSLLDETLTQLPFIGPAGEAIGKGAYRWEQLFKTGSFTGEEKAKKSHLGTQAEIVQDAANKYHIPDILLWGIYGIETAHGANVKTSSTGAVGPFQFEPATARQYGYPLTNKPTPAQFQKQAEAAAHYLSDAMGGLKAKRTNANLERAVKIYNSGKPNAGYSLKEVLAHSGSLGKVFGAESENLGEQAKVEESGNAKNPLEGIEAFFEAIGQVSTWTRIGKGVAGLVLIYMGLREFTKLGPSAGDVVAAPLGAPGRVVRHHQAKKASAAADAERAATKAASAREAASRQSARAAAAKRPAPVHHHQHIHLHEKPAASAPAGKTKATKGHGRPKGR